MVRGKRLTSWPSLQTDVRNAGGDWVDEQVVVDGNLITSRKPDDLPAFNGALLEAVNHGVSSAAAAADVRLASDRVAEGRAHATWKDRLARPIWKSSMTSWAAPSGRWPRRG